jgi:hypothetical protein
MARAFARLIWCARMSSRWWSRTGARARGLLVLACAALIAVALHVGFCRGLLRATRGQWIAPIDDTYIHLQYASALAEGRGLQYQPGDGYSGGATSPLWVALLAPAAATLSPAHQVAASFGLGAFFFGLALLALGLAAEGARRREGPEGDPADDAAPAASTRRRRSIAAHLAGLPTAAAPALAFFAGQGFLSWAALSGMETMMFAALLLAALALVARWSRQLARHGAAAPPPSSLLAVCALLPLARPDGVLVSGLVVALILWRGRLGRRALLSAAAVTAPAVIALVAHHLAYGRFATAGLEMKAASYLPYLEAGEARALTAKAAWRAVRHLFGGAPGFPPVALSIALAALGLVALSRELRERRVGAAALAWPLLLLLLWSGASVAVPQFRQDRYFVPAIAALALLGALGAAELGAQLSRLGGRFAALAPLALDVVLVIAALIALSPSLRFWQRSYAADAVAIQRKQVSAAHWIAERTPPDASVLVCDAGALAFLSHRRVFDIVGLAAHHAGNSYLSGAGSRFEEMERAGPSRWPTHAALYSWCGWPGVSMETLSTHADLVVSRFIDPGLGSAESPLRPDLARRDLLDRIDLADLASEQAHHWRERGGGSRDRNVIGRQPFEGRPVADGGRVIVTSATFTLVDPGTLTAGRALALRTAPGAQGSLLIGGSRRPIAAPGNGEANGDGKGDAFVELLFPIPDQSRGDISITVEASPGAPLPLYSVWLLGER